MPGLSSRVVKIIIKLAKFSIFIPGHTATCYWKIKTGIQPLSWNSIKKRKNIPQDWHTSTVLEFWMFSKSFPNLPQDWHTATLLEFWMLRRPVKISEPWYNHLWEKNAVNIGRYILPSTPKGSARTSLGPKLKQCVVLPIVYLANCLYLHFQFHSVKWTSFYLFKQNKIFKVVRIIHN